MGRTPRAQGLAEPAAAISQVVAFYAAIIGLLIQQAAVAYWPGGIGRGMLLAANELALTLTAAVVGPLLLILPALAAAGVGGLVALCRRNWLTLLFSAGVAALSAFGIWRGLVFYSRLCPGAYYCGFFS